MQLSLEIWQNNVSKTTAAEHEKIWKNYLYFYWIFHQQNNWTIRGSFLQLINGSFFQLKLWFLIYFYVSSNRYAVYWKHLLQRPSLFTTLSLSLSLSLSIFLSLSFSRSLSFSLHTLNTSPSWDVGRWMLVPRLCLRWRCGRISVDCLLSVGRKKMRSRRWVSL